jgi:hypothetical protein
MPGKAKSRKPRAAREKATAYRTSRQAILKPREQRAIEDFRARLKEILPAGALKSLILYGSRARGEARPNADIDLLVVYDATQGDKGDAIWDASSDVELDHTDKDSEHLVDIQPIVLTGAELERDAALGMPLLLNVAREGIVLEGEPIMPAEMDRNYWSSLYIEDARQELASAELLLASGDVRRPIEMAFSVYEKAARAALVAKGIVPKSHTGTRDLFGKHSVRIGLVSKKFAVHFERMEKDRLDATYALQKKFTCEDAERALERARELLTTIENLLPKLLKEK